MRAPNSPESETSMSTHNTPSHGHESVAQQMGLTRSNDQTRSRSNSRLTRWPAAVILVAAVGAVGGCGSSASPAPAAPTVVVTQTVGTPSVQTVTETVQATAPAAVPEPSEAPAKPASMVTVPDGVGMNYQEAQDAWRAAGLHVAPAEDETGANRVPVLDRNWVVVSQDLEPGSKVATDSFITATVKKFTDS